MRLIIVLFLALLTACAAPPRKGLPVKRGPQPAPEWRSNGALLLRFDENQDREVSRAEMEVGLKKHFSAEDKNHDGSLDSEEVTAVNYIRWVNDSSATSPLIDWNKDGIVNLREYSATTETLFNELDKDGDGLVTGEELRPKRNPRKPGGDKRRMKRRN